MRSGLSASREALSPSVIRRMERFFNHHPLCPADVAVVVLKLLLEARKREFILDHTHWKLGQLDVNALVLAVLWRGVAIPLLFELLPHGGSSRTEIRLTLISDVLCLLSCREIAMLYADREFTLKTGSLSCLVRGFPSVSASDKTRSLTALLHETGCRDCSQG
ncbi:hypothetical protein [Deinococcus aquatilis]|uniref:hypothetical protein n=1 Tax=Deinococcus aquatilis TaxID=519440 RepID=UPI001FE1C935|nr:hypothetical protein [Deinococcus aquatilis]